MISTETSLQKIDKGKVKTWEDATLYWSSAAAAAAKSLQSSPTLCDPIEGSPSGSPIPGILQARTLDWVAISFSNAGKWKVKVKSFSHVQLFATPWTAAYQAPPSMGFSRQEYWSGVPLPSPYWSSGKCRFKAPWHTPRALQDAKHGDTGTHHPGLAGAAL